MYFLIRVHITNRKKNYFMVFCYKTFASLKLFWKSMSSLPSTTSALSFFIAHKIVPLSSCVKRGSNEISACMQTNIDRFLILFLDCRQILAADTTKHCSQQEYHKKTETDILWWNGREVCFPPNFSLYIFVFTKQIFTYKFLFSRIF